MQVNHSNGLNSYDLRNNKKWYVLANRTDAVIYKDAARAKFEFVERLSHSPGRLTESQLNSDRPGRGNSSATRSIRHSLDRHHQHHENEAKSFARKIASTLEKAQSEERFAKIVLVAEPHFLGLLKAVLSRSVKQSIQHTLPKEYRQGSDRQLRSLVFNAIGAEA